MLMLTSLRVWHRNDPQSLNMMNPTASKSKMQANTIYYIFKKIADMLLG